MILQYIQLERHLLQIEIESFHLKRHLHQMKRHLLQMKEQLLHLKRHRHHPEPCFKLLERLPRQIDSGKPFQAF